MYGINYLVHLSLDQDQLEIGKIILNLEDFEIILNKGLKVISIIVIMYLSINIGKYLIKKVVDKQVKSNAALSLDPQRAKTLGGVMRSILKYSVYSPVEIIRSVIIVCTAFVKSVYFSDLYLRGLE